MQATGQGVARASCDASRHQPAGSQSLLQRRTGHVGAARVSAWWVRLRLSELPVDSKRPDQARCRGCAHMSLERRLRKQWPMTTRCSGISLPFWCRLQAGEQQVSAQAHGKAVQNLVVAYDGFSLQCQ